MPGLTSATGLKVLRRVQFNDTGIEAAPGSSMLSPMQTRIGPVERSSSLRGLTWVVLLFGLTSAALSAEPSGRLRIGTARIDITPTQPVRMAGYASRTNLSTGVHDPLSARAVAFEQDGRRLVLVSTEILGFYGGTCEPLRAAILEACQLKPAELFLAAIHTHAAPTPTLDPATDHPHNVAYTRTLQTQLVHVVQASLARLTPGSVGVGIGSSPVGSNRRERVTDSRGQSKIVLGRNPSAPTDRDVQVLKISGAAPADPAAVIFAYATHSTSLGPRNYLISGDVHGLAAQFVERYLGRGVLASPFAGASGDIDPWFRVLPAFNTTNGWMPEPVLLGTLLGEEVAHVLNGIKAGSSNGPVRTAFQTLMLPGKSGAETGAPAAAAPVEFNVTVGRVGDVAFVGLGGEVFNEIGRAIKTVSPFTHTVVITHCNGAAGYLPTRPSYAEGGYEVQSSRFAPAAADQVVAEAVRLLKAL
jgi:hypothetical protein